MNGAELSLRFSFIVNELAYCGPCGTSTEFLDYFKTHETFGSDAASTFRDRVKRFEGLYPYLEAIATKHGKDFLDYDVVEAYWIGNSLLDAFGPEDLALVIDRLTRRGLPERFAGMLKEGLPSYAVPHHLFHVCYVGAGRTTGTVPTNLQTMNNCRISWGKVITRERDTLLVKTQPLSVRDGAFFLGPEEVKTAVYHPALLPEVAVGSSVALHWGFAALVLSDDQLSRLQHYSTRVLDALNAQSHYTIQERA